MVNAYNPCILLHWQANMDIQMVDGPLGIAYYICSYVCKAEPNILKNALAQTLSNMNTANAEPSMRSRLSKIGFCILKHRTLSAQEAAYRIGNLQLVWYSREIVRVIACKPEKRFKRLKSKQQIQFLSDNTTDVFDYNIFDYYYARPESLENLSIFRFIRLYKVSRQIPKTKQVIFT